MTCAIAIPVQREGRIVLASGSRIIEGTKLCAPIPKIFDLCSGYVAVASGDLSDIQTWLRRCADESPEAIDRIARLAKGLSEFEALVTREGLLWSIDGDGVVASECGVQTIGNGGDIARGFIGACRKPTTVRAARKLALRALGFVSTVYVCEGPPFVTRAV